MTTRRLALSLAQAAALAAASAGAEPARYDSPEAAVAALRAALEAEGIDPLLTIFGAESEDLISTGDAAEDADIRARLLEGWDELHRIGRETGGDKAVLYLGRDLWSFPLPLLKADDGTWAFDPVEGRETVIDRRIGRNELDVIELMLAYVRVQRDYRAVDWDGDGVMEFAAHVISTEGTRDGLYWPPEEGAPDSPVGDFVARAAAEGFTVGRGGGRAGALSRLRLPHPLRPDRGRAGRGDGIPRQRQHGRRPRPDRLSGRLRETGVMSFMVGENGVVLEADLGETTLETAGAMDRFDPAPDWRPVD